MTTVQILLFLTKILPLIQLLVSLAEQFHPQPGSGAAKMQLVVSTVGKVASKIPEFADQVEQVKEAARPLVESTVALMNSVKEVAQEIKMVGSGEPGQQS